MKQFSAHKEEITSLLTVPYFNDYQVWSISLDKYTSAWDVHNFSNIWQYEDSHGLTIATLISIDTTHRVWTSGQGDSECSLRVWNPEVLLFFFSFFFYFLN